MDHMNELTRILSELKHEHSSVRKELRNYPKERLMLVYNHGSIQKISVRDDGTRKGIGRDVPLVHKLARRTYLSEYDRRICLNIKLLEDLLRKYCRTDLSDILQSLPGNYEHLPDELLITSAVKAYKHRGPFPDTSVPIRDAQLVTGDLDPMFWGSIPYRPNTLNQHKKQIRMTDGLLVRSKSEASIIGIYKNNRIPYHYDEVLNFSDLLNSSPDRQASHDRGTTKTIFSPDFIAARKDGKLIYHEHAGLMDDPDYAEAFQRKPKPMGHARSFHGTTL